MNAKNTAVIMIPANQAEQLYFQSQASDWNLIFEENPTDILLSAEVIIGTPPLELIRGTTELRLLQTSTAGVNDYACQPGFPEQTRLCSARGAYGLAVSEHMLGMLFELFKKLRLYRDEQNRGRWSDLGQVHSIENARILVIGLGDIGSSFAKKVHALGAHVFAVSHSQNHCPEFVDAVYSMDQLNHVLSSMDAVALSLPDTAETRGLFDQARISHMKKGSFLLNVGRGSAIDTDALLFALRSGHLAGAGLDVTAPEPLPEDHPLWREPHAVITPHISGWYHLPQTYQRIVQICGENLRRYAQGLPLNNEIDPKTGAWIK